MKIHKLPSNEGKNPVYFNKEDFNVHLKLINEGNQQLREDFIEMYRPFILRVTSTVLNKYIDARDSDEFAVAQEAFNEAIDRFKSGSRSSFLSYAEKVIRSRIIDYLRKNTTKEQLCATDDSEILNEIDRRYPSDDSYSQFEVVENREEIEEFKKMLKEFDISISDLLNSTPKHNDSRELCYKIAQVLSEDEHLYGAMLKNKSIPRSELLKKVNVHENTLAKNRKYIIAISLILRSDLEVAKSILKN